MDNKENKEVKKPKSAGAEVAKEDGEFVESVNQIKANIEVKVPESPREVVDDDIDFGAMSSEIASKVKANIPEEVPVEGRVDSVMSEVGSVGGVEKLDEFLDDIGITRQQFYIFVVIVVVFLTGVFVSFYYLVSWFAGGPRDILVDEPVAPPIVIEEVQKESFFSRVGSWWSDVWDGFRVNTDDSSNDDGSVIVDQPDEQVITPDRPNRPLQTDGLNLTNQVGNQVAARFSSQAVELGFLIGTSNKQTNKLSEYIRNYRELRAVFNVDLLAYLSVLDDREKGFDDYINRLKGVYQKSLLTREDLLLEIDEYKGRLQQVESQLKSVEAMFFGELEALNSESISELLVSFQEIGRRQVVITSELKARQAILDRYNGARNIVADRIRAIELNRDAFVKGVQVVDYRNIDLDLIIRQ